MRRSIAGLGLVMACLVTTAGCAEVLVSRPAKNGVVLTTGHEAPQGYEVVGTVHAQSTIWRFLGAAVGPVMTDLNDRMSEEAQKLGGNAVIGVTYSQDWFSYQASGTAVKFKR